MKGVSDKAAALNVLHRVLTALLLVLFDVLLCSAHDSVTIAGYSFLATNGARAIVIVTVIIC